MLSALYYNQDTSLPLAFELIKKTVMVTDPKTGQDKWQSPVTKHELARAMMAAIAHKQIPFRYGLTAIWFTAAANLVFIKEKLHKDFIVPLKSNRRGALNLNAKQRGRWTTLTTLKGDTEVPQTLHLEGVPLPVVVARQVFTNEDGSENLLYLVSSDVSLSAPSLFSIYQKRWKGEEYHKSLKSNAALAKSPTKLPHTQHNHVFASIVAFTKLEAYRTATRLNHFALKGKLYQAALTSALAQLQQLKRACPAASIIT